MFPWPVGTSSCTTLYHPTFLLQHDSIPNARSWVTNRMTRHLPWFGDLVAAGARGEVTGAMMTGTVRHYVNQPLAYGFSSFLACRSCHHWRRPNNPASQCAIFGPRHLHSSRWFLYSVRCVSSDIITTNLFTNCIFVYQLCYRIVQAKCPSLQNTLIYVKWFVFENDILLIYLFIPCRPRTVPQLHMAQPLHLEFSHAAKGVHIGQEYTTDVPKERCSCSWKVCLAPHSILAFAAHPHVSTIQTFRVQFWRLEL